MKQMLNRIPALLLVMALLLNLAGCGMADKNTAAQEQKDYDTIAIVWPCSSTAPEGLAAVQEAANEIVREKLGVEIELKAMSYSVKSQALAISSGEQLDLMVSMYEGLEYFTEGDYILPLDSYMETYGQDILTQAGEELVGGYRKDKLYGIHAKYAHGYRKVYLCRKDLLDKYHIVIDPEHVYSLDELEDIFATVKQGEGEDFYPLLGGEDSILYIATGYDNLGASSGSSLNSGCIFPEKEDGKVYNLYATEEYKAYAERMYRWAQAGYFDPETISGNTNVITSIKNGHCLGLFLNDAGELEETYPVVTGCEMVSIPMNEPCLMTSTYQDILWCVSKTCEHPEEAVEVLNLLYQDTDLANLLQYGLEGVSYEKVASDEYGTVINFPEGETRYTVPYYMPLNIYGNQLNKYILSPGTTRQKFRIRQFGDAITNISPAFGYIFDSTNVEEKIVAVNQVLDNYEGILEYGLMDPDIELPLFLADLEEAGIDEIVAENQKQYDTWRQKKNT